MMNYKECFDKLFEYVKKEDYIGYDLFDGLNSKLFKNTFLYKSGFFRLCLIQFCKHSPINFRKLLFVEKSFNPKGGALFLLGLLNMYQKTREEIYKTEAEKIFDRLKNCAIKREKGIGFGYNFDWQARAFFVPIGTPNVVTSVYVGEAFLEYFKLFNDQSANDMAKEIVEFIVNEMVMKETEDELCFNYIPKKDAEVHNANLLAARYLANFDGYERLIKKSVKFSTKDINQDGSWAYGTKPFHRWVDNFHTAFNIESLSKIYPDSDIYKKVVDYFVENLFDETGLPKYYNNKLYPIDIHVIAEDLIVIKSLLKDYDSPKIGLITEKLNILLKEFSDKKGYFYYQKTNKYLCKIPYIRWNQAWVFYALSVALLND